MCSCDDGDRPKVIEQLFRKARGKAARQGYGCCECGKLIKHGDWYLETSGLWGESWDCYRTCLKCAARREAWASIECHPVFGGVSETILECLVTNNYDRGTGHMRRHIDRSAGRDYLRALRVARAAVGASVSRMSAARAERYVAAAVERERQRRIKADLGAGI